MTYKEQHPKLPTKTHSQQLEKKIIHILHTFIPLNVKNQFTSTQDQEKQYISQKKLF